MVEERTEKTVLIVEDDGDLIEMMGIVLEAASYRVVRALNGREALAEVAKQIPGLILLDMKMPVMDGWEFAKRLNAQYDASIAIVVVTAAADARARATEIGAQGYLPKPFDLDDLVRCVDKHYPSSHSTQ